MTGNPSQAARHFKTHATTIRRWIEHGCPVVRPGGHGPGQAALLNFAAVAKWRGTGSKSEPVEIERLLALVAEAFADCLAHDRIEERTGATKAEAAALLMLCFERTAKLLGKRYTLDTLPKGIHALMHLL